MAKPKIGFLGATTPLVWHRNKAAFNLGMKKLGYTTADIECRWAHGKHYRRAARELIDAGVKVIVTGGTHAIQHAQDVTSGGTPIVFATAGDESVAGPGKNTTGIGNQQDLCVDDRLKWLKQIIPNIERVAVVGNFDLSNVCLELTQVKAKAAGYGLHVVECGVSTRRQIESCIQDHQDDVDALYVCTDPFVTTNAKYLNSLANDAGLPTMHGFEDYLEWGGLMSYGARLQDLFFRTCPMVHAIATGAARAEGTPCQHPGFFEFKMNFRIARTLGLTIPEALIGVVDVGAKP
jgi:putative tryptophan/tyrosine transport system substrate-binding protein